MNPEVTSIGDINVDIITAKVGDMPQRDSQVIAPRIALSSGGCAANFANAISLLGTGTRFMGKVGDDVFGDFLRGNFSGVELILSMGNRTGITIAITLEDDTRSFITCPGANSEFGIEDIDFGLIEGEHLHIASFFLQGLRGDTSEILEYARERGMLISLDTGWDPGGWSDDDTKLVKEVLRGVDIFFPNVREGKAITGAEGEEDICKRLLSLGPGVIGLKKGGKGSCIATKDEFCSVPAFGVETVDTTGAGDVFDAAFVFGYLKNWDLEEVGIFANAAAALSTTGYGTERYPSREEVIALTSR
jgi:sugar/nucleoside kinase (ribokinase family)